jgi:hypothetical protein
MKLYRIGDTVLNMDRVNGIIDHHAPADPDGAGDRTVLRIVFDHATIDLTEKEAQVFRRWYRHASLNLAPHKDETGEPLLWPEDQVAKAFETLLRRIDRARPRDSAMRHTAHRVKGIIDQYLTGELQPVRAREFERCFAEAESDG